MRAVSRRGPVRAAPCHPCGGTHHATRCGHRGTGAGRAPARRRRCRRRVHRRRRRGRHRHIPLLRPTQRRAQPHALCRRRRESRQAGGGGDRVQRRAGQRPGPPRRAGTKDGRCRLSVTVPPRSAGCARGGASRRGGQRAEKDSEGAGCGVDRGADRTGDTRVVPGRERRRASRRRCAVSACGWSVDARGRSGHRGIRRHRRRPGTRPESGGRRGADVGAGPGALRGCDRPAGDAPRHLGAAGTAPAVGHGPRAR